MMLEDDVLSARVRTTMGELLEGAEQLKGLAQTLDGFCGLSGRADPEEIKQVAIGVRATAAQALLTASSAVGLSERLATVAFVLESVASEDDEDEGSAGDEDAEEDKHES